MVAKQEEGKSPPLIYVYLTNQEWCGRCVLERALQDGSGYLVTSLKYGTLGYWRKGIEGCVFSWWNPVDCGMESRRHESLLDWTARMRCVHPGL